MSRFKKYGKLIQKVRAEVLAGHGTCQALTDDGVCGHIAVGFAANLCGATGRLADLGGVAALCSKHLTTVEAEDAAAEAVMPEDEQSPIHAHRLA